MNNTTIEEIKIKRRGDGVYDIYFNKEWIASRGTYAGVFAAIIQHVGYVDGAEKGEDNQI